MVYDLFKHMLNRSNISHVHIYFYGKHIRIHYMDCIRFCTDTSFFGNVLRMGKITGKRKETTMVETRTRIVPAVIKA